MKLNTRAMYTMNQYVFYIYYPQHVGSFKNYVKKEEIAKAG